MDLLENLVNNRLFPVLAPKILPDTYGAFTCMWAMCDDTSYQRAKKLIFKGQEEEYASFIERIEKYHRIQNNLEEMLMRYQAEGLNIAFVTKYNYQLKPLFKNNLAQSDETVELNLASLGATAADYGKVLSKKYISTRDPKYISPDHIIDASTCVFPDSTWFIKNVHHSSFTWSIDVLMSEICKYDGQMTIDSMPKYPQYMEFRKDLDIIVPLIVEEEPTQSDSARSHHIVQELIRWLKAVFEYIKMLLQKNAK